MKRSLSICIMALALGSALAAQQQAELTELASNPMIELEGKISSVQVAPGRGMPFLEIESKGETIRVYLGSMRFLMQNDFNPKAGEEVKARGFRRDGDLVAISVTLISQDKTLRLRDDEGLPLWRGGRRSRYRSGRSSEARESNQ